MSAAVQRLDDRDYPILAAQRSIDCETGASHDLCGQGVKIRNQPQPRFQKIDHPGQRLMEVIQDRFGRVAPACRQPFVAPQPSIQFGPGRAGESQVPDQYIPWLVGKWQGEPFGLALRTMDLTAVHAAAAVELHAVKDDEPVCLSQKPVVPSIRIEIGLHDGDDAVPR